MKGLFNVILIVLIAAFISCGSKPEPFKIGSIPDNTFDPQKWSKAFPLHYESWLKTKDPKPSNKSKYRKGWDKDKIVYDKLSAYPFAALLYNGWGFGIAYNEPRGHYYAIIDQVEIDPSRTGPGGVCLACKTPYHKTYTEKYGMKYLKAKFKAAINMLPKGQRNLGPACIDCHKPSDMSLTTNKAHITRGLKMIGKKSLTRQEKRTMACAQCHMTYYVPRTKNKKVAGDVMPPWTGGKWGNIPIEVIAKDLFTNYKRIEWKQKTTGFNMPYIRHPEFEVFTRNSVHFNAGLSCADCHMPYKRSGSYKISDHDVTSPLKTDLRACAQCHTESAGWLKKQVTAIQDRVVSLQIRAGYSVATCAKLFEMLHKKQKSQAEKNTVLYKKAKELYMQAFIRLNFISAENSTGFHNPTEATRVLGDSVAFAGKSEALLRQILTKKGVNVPIKINLELNKYLNNRGKHKMMFKKKQEVKDPFGLQGQFTQR